MEINPETLPWQSLYKILIGSVVPRPIGWVSSLAPSGMANLAPFSFFTVVCPQPPTILFCPSVRGTDLKEKDTLQNIRKTGEFVVNIVTEDLAVPMNITSTEFPPEVDEFQAAGLTPVPSQLVKPPRIGESPIHFECKLIQIDDFGSHPGGGSIVIGQIVHMHIQKELLIGTDKIDLHKLRPIGRLAGSEYTRVTDLFEMQRPPSQLKPLSSG